MRFTKGITLICEIWRSEDTPDVIDGGLSCSNHLKESLMHTDHEKNAFGGQKSVLNWIFSYRNFFLSTIFPGGGRDLPEARDL